MARREILLVGQVGCQPNPLILEGFADHLRDLKSAGLSKCVVSLQKKAPDAPEDAAART